LLDSLLQERMGTTEKFCLRWNDFESNISLAFRDIREEKDFFDCTLSCGSRQIQAHKLILSACSPFFRSILKQNPHQHPLLYLKGVQFTDMQAVLNFMYHGEVNVAQEELNSFLAVAEDLEVKGLTQNNSSNHKPRQDHPQSPPLSSSTYSKPRPNDPEPPVPVPPKRLRTLVSQPAAQPSYQQNEDDDILEVLPTVKTEPIAPTIIPYQPTKTNPYVQSHTEGMETMGSMGMQVTSMEESYGEDSYDSGGYEGDGQGYEGVVGLNPGIVDQSKGPKSSCPVCLKVMLKTNIRKHMKKNHAPYDPAECPFCFKVFKTNYNMKDHVRHMHK